MKGWIDLENAADRLARHSRHKPFRSLPKGEAKKVLRELRDLIVTGTVSAQAEGDGKRYRQLAISDALSQPFGIHFELDNSVGVETVFDPGVLWPMLLREVYFANLKLAPPTRIGEWLEYKDLIGRGVKIQKTQILRLEKKGEFPAREYQTARRPVWRTSYIDAYVADPEKWRAMHRKD